MSEPSLEARLVALEAMPFAELRAAWTALTSEKAPNLRAPLLRLALGYEMQARAHGDLSRKTRQAIEQAGRGLTRTHTARSGTRLAREWNGRVHIVTIDEDGVIAWNDKTWRSLSQVARAITGTRWSGPAFFGLKEKIAR